MTTIKKITVFTILLIFNLSFCQKEFKRGFIIKNDGNKIDCLIQEEDWKYNPDTFTYKLDGSDDLLTASLNDISSFGVANEFKYVKKETFLDKESLNKPVFLNVLLEGQVSIYQYKEKGVNLFFYKEADSEDIFELLYIDNTNKKNGDLLTSSKFRSQLYKSLGANQRQLNDFKTLKYKKREILNIVSEFNRNNNVVYSKFYDDSVELTKIYLKAGLGTTPIVVSNTSLGEISDFGNNSGFRFGFEIEYFLPSKSQKWSITASPIVKFLNAEESVPTQAGAFDTEFKYMAFEMHFGARHYFTDIENDSRFYANAGFNVEIPVNSEFTFENESVDVGIASIFNSYIGVGYQYKRFGAEVIYMPNVDLIKTNNEFSVEFETFAFQLTYSLF